MKRKQLEEDIAPDGQVERARSRARRLGLVAQRQGRVQLLVLGVFELQVEDDVSQVALDGLRDEFDLYVQVVEHLAYLSQLTLHVGHVALAFASVVQSQALGALLFDEETRRLQLRVAESHVLVQVVQTVQEISHVTTQDPFKILLKFRNSFTLKLINTFKLLQKIEKYTYNLHRFLSKISS